MFFREKFAPLPNLMLPPTVDSEISLESNDNWEKCV